MWVLYIGCTVSGIHGIILVYSVGDIEVVDLVNIPGGMGVVDFTILWVL